LQFPARLNEYTPGEETVMDLVVSPVDQIIAPEKVEVSTAVFPGHREEVLPYTPGGYGAVMLTVEV
jgi:hypothetical protein